MSTHKLAFAAALIGALAFTHAASAQVAHYGFGSAATPDDLSRFFSIPPDGRGLPPGSGNAAKGAQIYAGACAACHGDKLEGNPAKGIGGDKLLGGHLINIQTGCHGHAGLIPAIPAHAMRARRQGSLHERANFPAQGVENFQGDGAIRRCHGNVKADLGFSVERIGIIRQQLKAINNAPYPWSSISRKDQLSFNRFLKNTEIRQLVGFFRKLFRPHKVLIFWALLPYLARLGTVSSASLGPIDPREFTDYGFTACWIH